ncbi:MAG TPA: PH domain-containing protein [Trebonia sp.]
MGFLLIGASMLANEREAGGVSGLVVGGLLIVLACVAGSASITSVVVLTPEGITWRYNFRRKTIPWEAVEAFGISPVPGMVWSRVVVELRPLGKARIESIAGTRRYIRRIIAEFEAFHAQLLPATGSDGD